MKKFSGLYTALVTPFTDDNKIDYKALTKILDSQIKAKVVGLVIMGTTGESPNITDTERVELFKFIKAHVGSKLDLILGTGTNSTTHSIEQTKQAEKLGADAVLVVNPYYNKPSQEGMFLHFSAVAKATKLPVILYNIQGRTSVNLQTSTLLRLIEKNKNIVAVKEASGDIMQMMEVLKSVPSYFSVLSGDDGLTYPLIALGGHGVVSVLSNIAPTETNEFVQAALKGDFAKARKLHFKLLPKMQGCFIGGNPVAVKTALSQKGLIKPNFRLPLTLGSKDEQEKIKAIFKA